MCGIAGVWGNEPGGSDRVDVVLRMASALHHRGPDGVGTYDDPQAQLGLAHARLAVVDLSDAGHQPFASASGRFVVTYNGEVFNHRELRVELEAAGYRFRGTCDTEVLVNGFEYWGIRGTVERCNGMLRLVHGILVTSASPSDGTGSASSRSTGAGPTGCCASHPTSQPSVQRAQTRQWTARRWLRTSCMAMSLGSAASSRAFRRSGRGRWFTSQRRARAPTWRSTGATGGSHRTRQPAGLLRPWRMSSRLS
ncbi:MAG: hypothetical protein IPN77_32360 [Sandaracinaceae bacterium]|nr:hypothetical protein [Sandaracinaceae bacterium]